MNDVKQMSLGDAITKEDAANWSLVRQIFSQAALLPDSKRHAFVQAQSPNPQVAAEVIELLRWDQQDNKLLDSNVGKSLGENVSPPLSNTRDFVPPSVAGYENMQFLAEGGESIVYRAVQSSTGQTVVIKFSKGRSDKFTNHTARHKREIAVLSKLQHPNIVSVLDCGTTPDNQFYYVARYIEGHDLDKYVKSTALTPKQCLLLCLRIIEAMESVHRHGVIHRDIKPSNIRIDKNGQPLILDFGLAKAEHTERKTVEFLRSNPAAFMGSVPWASPEQIDHQIGNVSNRTDIYQLGLICYEVFSRGQLPYKIDSSISASFSTILHTPPLPLSKVCGDPRLARLDAVLLKAVEKTPSQRFASAGEFAKALSKAAADSGKQTISQPNGEAKSPSNPTTPDRPKSSGRWKTAFVTLASLTLATGLLLAAWMAYMHQTGTTSVGSQLANASAQQPAVQDQAEFEPPPKPNTPSPPENPNEELAATPSDDATATEPPWKESEVAGTGQDSPPKTTIADDWGDAKPVRGFEQNPFNKNKPQQVPLDQLVSKPGGLDFLNIKPGELPQGWSAIGGVGLNFADGIPGLGKTATGASENLATCSEILLGGNFFVEFQLADVTDSELGFILDATKTGEQVHFTLEEQRASVWALHAHGLKIPSLIPYLPRPDIWVYLEHVPDGLFITLNGDPASRQRIGDFQPCQFDQLQLDFNHAPTKLKIQNMRWGPITEPQAVATLPFGNNRQRANANGVADGWVLVGNALSGERRRYRTDKLQIGNGFQIDFEVEAKLSTTMSFNLLGANSEISVPIYFYFHRGWVYITLGNQRAQFDATKFSHGTIKIQCRNDRLNVSYGDPSQSISLDAKQSAEFSYIEMETLAPPKSVKLLRLPVVRPLAPTS